MLDEVQLLGDRGRGWAWTRALLGLPARTLHVCGDAAAEGIVSQLAADVREALSVLHYARLTPLQLESRAVRLHDVNEGDCVVAFGRATLHRLRRSVLALRCGTSDETVELEDVDGRQQQQQRPPLRGVAMLYGSLPPEARRAQAALFNAGGCACDAQPCAWRPCCCPSTTLRASAVVLLNPPPPLPPPPPPPPHTHPPVTLTSLPCCIIWLLLCHTTHRP